MAKKIEVFASEALPGELEDFPDIKRGWGTTKESTGGIPPMKWFNAIQKRTDELLNELLSNSISETDLLNQIYGKGITRGGEARVGGRVQVDGKRFYSIEVDGVKRIHFLWSSTTNETFTIKSIKKNSFLGVDIESTNGDVAEFVLMDVFQMRWGSPTMSANPTPFVEGWGAEDGKDSTLAFKKAIEFARKFNTCINSKAGNFLISERLFFGPINDSDLATSDGFPINICLGFIGDNVASTKITPTASLAGDVVIDMTGMRDKVLKNFSINVTSPANCPAVGILTARFARTSIVSVTNNDWGEFDSVRVTKYFSVAPYFAGCTEEIYVKNCNFRTDHNDARGAFVSTADIHAVWPEIKEAKETNLKFTTGRISNLHQNHINCDYYVGSINPTFEKIGMIYIRDSLMVNIENPFFNNNATMIDCVVVDADPSTAYVYGIHVRNANFHQRTKSGMRMLAANTNCSLQCSSKTHDFTEGALIVERYTNGFFSSWLDGDLVIKSGGMDNSQITSCRDLIWSEKATIEGSFIGVRGDIKTDPTGRVATNNFQINHKGKLFRIVGYYGHPETSALNVQCNKRSTNNLSLSTNYNLFDSNLLQLSAVETTTGFNFVNLSYKGVDVLSVDKNGVIKIKSTGGGIQMADSSGEMRKLVFNSDGTVSASKV